MRFSDPDWNPPAILMENALTRDDSKNQMWVWYHNFFQGFKSTDMLELYDINPVFSFYINKLSAIYLFLTLLLVKLFLQAMALQYFLHCFG